MIKFENYGNYSSDNYGVNSLCFTDASGNTFYFSYKTLVAFYHQTTHKKYVRQNEWGTTTGKHLNWIDGGMKEKRLSEDEFNSKLKELIGGCSVC